MLGKKRTFSQTQEEAKMTSPDPMEEDHDENTQPQISAQSQLAATTPHYSPELLGIYYDRLFPYRPLFDWLSYFNDPERDHPLCNPKYWRHREFSFTLEDDIYIRFKSFPTLEDFKKELKRRKPIKMDIGAVYGIEPNRKKSVPADKFVPEEKELVFDIDISDYDDVRVCCQGGGICRRCWPLMACAIRVVEQALRGDFGFKNLLWVFSGRRGIHCWVTDPSARVLNTHQRTAIIEYLHVHSDSGQNTIKADLSSAMVVHTSLRRAFDICLPYFETCAIEEQGMLDDEEKVTTMLNMVRFPELLQELQTKLSKTGDKTGLDRWNIFKSVYENAMSDKEPRKQSSLVANLYEIVFGYVYPRLDVEVSRHMNHLLKSPFVVHPKTGKVCTIIDPATCDDFDPETQPTLVSLVDELNAVGETSHRLGWRDTSLKGVVETFRRTFLNDIERQSTSLFRD